MDIIVCDEKHGPAYWDATTVEAWQQSSLAILTERWNQGYWYYDDGGTWYARAKAAVENQDATVAWDLLDARSDHEYEGVTIETLQRVPTKLP